MFSRRWWFGPFLFPSPRFIRAPCSFSNILPVSSLFSYYMPPLRPFLCIQPTPSNVWSPPSSVSHRPWLYWSNNAVVIHFTYKLPYQFKLGTVSFFCNRFWEKMSLVIHRNKNHLFQITSPWPPVTSSFGNLLWLISDQTPKCNILNIPIDMETIAWRAADTQRTFYG